MAGDAIAVAGSGVRGRSRSMVRRIGRAGFRTGKLNADSNHEKSRSWPGMRCDHSSSMNSHGPALMRCANGRRSRVRSVRTHPAVRKLHDRLVVHRRRTSTETLPSHQFKARSAGGSRTSSACNWPTLEPDRLGRPTDTLGAGPPAPQLDAIIGEAAQVGEAMAQPGYRFCSATVSHTVQLSPRWVCRSPVLRGLVVDTGLDIAPKGD